MSSSQKKMSIKKPRIAGLFNCEYTISLFSLTLAITFVQKNFS